MSRSGSRVQEEAFYIGIGMGYWPCTAFMVISHYFSSISLDFSRWRRSPTAIGIGLDFQVIILEISIILVNSPVDNSGLELFKVTLCATLNGSFTAFPQR